MSTQENFDVELIDFDTSLWKAKNPSKILKKVSVLAQNAVSSGKGDPKGVKKNFHSFFTAIAKEVFSSIKNTFPFLLSKSKILQLASRVLAVKERHELYNLYQYYRRTYPKHVFGIQRVNSPDSCTVRILNKI